MFDRETGGDFPSAVGIVALSQGHVENLAAAIADEVAVLLEIRAISGGLALDIHLDGQTAIHEGFKAVIDRGEGNRGHARLRPEKNLRGRRVIPLFQQYVINLPPLGRKSMAAMADRFLVTGFHHRELTCG